MRTKSKEGELQVLFRKAIEQEIGDASICQRQAINKLTDNL